MKLDLSMLKKVAAHEVAVGNIYPAKGGRSHPGTVCWLVVSLREHGCTCLGFNAQGEITSATNYLKSAMRERPILGRADVAAITLGEQK